MGLSNFSTKKYSLKFKLSTKNIKNIFNEFILNKFLLTHKCSDMSDSVKHCCNVVLLLGAGLANNVCAHVGAPVKALLNVRSTSHSDFPILVILFLVCFYN
jgi:hypothetical protein